MSFPNERFQIFFNRNSPLKVEDSFVNPPQTQVKPIGQIAQLSFSLGGAFQTNLYNNETLSLNDSKRNESLTGNRGVNTYTIQPSAGTTRYTSTYQADPYDQEANDYSDDQQDLTSIYGDDKERSDTSSLNGNSKRISKLNPQFKANNNKKVIQDSKIKTKRNPWQPEEDEQVIELVAKYGQSWALIASLIKDRSGKQIRDRYLNKLKPDINKSEWDQKEDDLLISLCRQFGHKWSRIATYLPGRTEGQVKNRFYSHIKKRFDKLGGLTGIQENSTDNNDDLFRNDVDVFKSLETDKHIKEEAFGFENNKEVKPTFRTIQTINSGGNFQIFSSPEEQKTDNTSLTVPAWNIKLNTFGTNMSVKRDQNIIPLISEGKLLAKKPVHAPLSFAKSVDPTDVISYSGMFGMSKPDLMIDEAMSPSSQFGDNLASTRASSLSQGKEFEEFFDKLMKKNVQQPLVYQPNPVKANGISISISNRGILPNNFVKNPEDTQLFAGSITRMINNGRAAF